MVKKIVCATIGVLLMFAAIWGGAFAMHTFGFDDWRNFPSFVTAMFVFFAGLGLLFIGTIEAHWL